MGVWGTPLRKLEKLVGRFLEKSGENWVGGGMDVGKK